MLTLLSNMHPSPKLERNRSWSSSDDSSPKPKRNENVKQQLQSAKKDQGRAALTLRSRIMRWSLLSMKHKKRMNENDVIDESMEKKQEGPRVLPNIELAKSEDVLDPVDYEVAIIDNIAKFYESNLVDSKSQLQIESLGDDVFVGKKMLKISIRDYLYRFVKYLNVWALRKNMSVLVKFDPNENDEIKRKMKVLSLGARAIISSTCLFEMMINKSNNKFHLKMSNVHRTILVCTMMSVKLNEDRDIKGRTIANIGGLKEDKVLSLELALCSILHFELYIKEEHYRAKYEQFTSTIKL